MTYSAKHRRTETEVSPKTPILAEVILKSRKRLEDDANKKMQELSPLVQPLTDRLAVIKKLIPEDDAGVQLRVKKYEEQIEKLVGQLKQVGDEFSAKTLETQDVMRLAQDRREEGYRLANQLELLRNDKFAALQQQKVLEFELIRLEENSHRLERRQKQLKQQLGDKYE